MQKLYDSLIPDFKKLWEDGEAEIRIIKNDDGTDNEVPFFNTEIVSMELVNTGIAFDRFKIPRGGYYEFTVETSDGIDRTARLYIPDDKFFDDVNLFIQANTAWCTTIKGHNDYAASSFISKTGLPVIMIGAEHGTTKHGKIKELGRLSETNKNSKGISLAKSAQVAQLITKHLIDRFNLPDTMIATGESRGAMIAPGQIPYANEHNINMPYIDITAPCVPERLFSDREDVHRLLGVPKTEILGAIALSVSLFKQDALKRRMGSTVLNPNFILSNTTGVRKALSSGEAGEFTRWVPKDIAKVAIYISTFPNDLISRPEIWQKLYSDHPNVFIRIHDQGSHLTLAENNVIDSKIERFNAFKAIYKSNNPFNQEDFQNIINSKEFGD